MRFKWPKLSNQTLKEITILHITAGHGSDSSLQATFRIENSTSLLYKKSPVLFKIEKGFIR